MVPCEGRSDLEEVVFKHAGGISGVNNVSDRAAGLLITVRIKDCDRVACEGIQELGAVSELAPQAGGVILARLLGNGSVRSFLGSSAIVSLKECDRPVYLRVRGIESELAFDADRSDSAVFASALIELEIAR